MADVSSRWAKQSVSGAAYDFVVERERLARAAGAVLWGTDTRLLFDSIDSIGAAPDTSAVLDVPCGGGLALRGLRPEQRARYVAADISPTMLNRARRLAADRGLHGIEFVEADVERLPFRDGEFDLCVSFNGLHCLPNPETAVAELARCLAGGGRLIGTCVVRGAGWRYDLTIEFLRRMNVFGPCGTMTDLRRWLTDAGLAVDRLHRSGSIAYFTATR